MNTVNYFFTRILDQPKIRDSIHINSIRFTKERRRRSTPTVALTRADDGSLLSQTEDERTRDFIHFNSGSSLLFKGSTNDLVTIQGCAYRPSAPQLYILLAVEAILSIHLLVPALLIHPYLPPRYKMYILF